MRIVHALFEGLCKMFSWLWLRGGRLRLIVGEIGKNESERKEGCGDNESGFTVFF